MEPTQLSLFFIALLPERFWASLMSFSVLACVVCSMTLFVHAKRFRCHDRNDRLALTIAILSRVGQVLLIPALIAYTIGKCRDGCTDPVVAIAFFGLTLTMIASALSSRREDLACMSKIKSRREDFLHKNYTTSRL